MKFYSINWTFTVSGVLIDQNLSWKHHVDSLIIKISKIIGMIVKLRYFAPSTVLVNTLQFFKLLV